MELIKKVSALIFIAYCDCFSLFLTVRWITSLLLFRMNSFEVKDGLGFHEFWLSNNIFVSGAVFLSTD
jgi:hypothetical protein